MKYLEKYNRRQSQYNLYVCLPVKDCPIQIHVKFDVEKSLNMKTKRIEFMIADIWTIVVASPNQEDLTKQFWNMIPNEWLDHYQELLLDYCEHFAFKMPLQRHRSVKTIVLK